MTCPACSLAPQDHPCRRRRELFFFFFSFLRGRWQETIPPRAGGWARGGRSPLSPRSTRGTMERSVAALGGGAGRPAPAGAQGDVTRNLRDESPRPAECPWDGVAGHRFFHLGISRPCPKLPKAWITPCGVWRVVGRPVRFFSVLQQGEKRRIEGFAARSTVVIQLVLGCVSHGPLDPRGLSHVRWPGSAVAQW